MSCRVEVRKTSVACDACKRRKGKCSGTIPCTHCKDSGIECSYLKGNKKRGPISKKRKMAMENEAQQGMHTNVRDHAAFKAGYREFRAVPSQRSCTPLAVGSSQYETALSNDVERSVLVELYLDHVSNATEKELLALKRHLMRPKTTAQHMRASSMMGYMARGFGQLARAEQFIGDARMFAAQVMEQRTADVAEAFVALSGYFPIRDTRNVLYLNMAHAISKTLALRSGSEKRLYNFSLIGSVILDNGMDIVTKRQILQTYSPKLRETIREPSISDILIAAIASFFCHITPNMLTCLDVMRVHKVKEVTFTKEETTIMMEDLRFMEQALVTHERNTHRKGLVFAIRVTIMILMWRSGDLEGALREADAAVEWDHFDALKYLSAITLVSEIPQNFWVLSLFYSHLGQMEKANTVYTMFTILCKLYGQPELQEFLPNPTTQCAGATLSEITDDGEDSAVSTNPSVTPRSTVSTVPQPSLPEPLTVINPAAPLSNIATVQQGIANLSVGVLNSSLAEGIVHMGSAMLNAPAINNPVPAPYLFTHPSTSLLYQNPLYPPTQHLTPVAPISALPTMYNPTLYSPYVTYPAPVNVAHPQPQSEIEELGFLDDLFSLQ